MSKDTSMQLNRFNMWTLIILVILLDRAHITRATEDIDSPLSISFDPPADQVQLNSPLVVRCSLRGGDADVDYRASMFLHCPIEPWGSFCFQNCESACASEEAGKCQYEKQLKPLECISVVQRSGQVIYEYTIPRLTTQWLATAGFYCKSAGRLTDKVALTLGLQRRNTTFRETTITTTPVPVPVLPVQPIEKPVSPAEGKLDSEATIPVDEELEIRTSAILRELLIVLAIIVVFISFALNVFCCIRCALIRQYSRTKDSPRMQHMLCMSEEIKTSRKRLQSRNNNNNNNDNNGKNSLNGDNSSSQHKSELLLQSPMAPDHYAYPIIQERLSAMTAGPFFQSHILQSFPNGPCHIDETQSNPAESFTDSHRSHLLPRNLGTTRRSIRDSRTSSAMLGIPGVEFNSSNPRLKSVVNAYMAKQQQNLFELEQNMACCEPSQTAGSQTAGSDGMTSCGGSLAGVPDSIISGGPSVLELSTLRRQQQSAMNQLTQPMPHVFNTHSVSQPINIDAGLDRSIVNIPQSGSNPNSTSVFRRGTDGKQSDSGTASGSDQLSIHGPQTLIMPGAQSATAISESTRPFQTRTGSMNGTGVVEGQYPKESGFQNTSTSGKQYCLVPSMQGYIIQETPLQLINGHQANIHPTHEMPPWPVMTNGTNSMNSNNNKNGYYGSIRKDSPHTPIRNGLAVTLNGSDVQCMLAEPEHFDAVNV